MDVREEIMDSANIRTIYFSPQVPIGRSIVVDDQLAVIWDPRWSEDLTFDLNSLFALPFRASEQVPGAIGEIALR